MTPKILSFDPLEDASAAPAIIRIGAYTWAWDLAGHPLGVMLSGDAEDASGVRITHALTGLAYRGLVDALPREWRRAHLSRYLGMSVTTGVDCEVLQ